MISRWKVSRQRTRVPDPLVLFGRDVDEHEPVVAEVLSDLDCVAAIGLSVFARARGHERGSGKLARDAPVSERPLEHVSGAGGLVAGANGTLGRETLEVTAEFLVIVGNSIDSHRFRIPIPKDGDRDGILVDIEADREHCSGHGLVSCAVRLTAAGGSGAPCRSGR